MSAHAEAGQNADQHQLRRESRAEDDFDKRENPLAGRAAGGGSGQLRFRGHIVIMQRKRAELNTSPDYVSELPDLTPTVHSGYGERRTQFDRNRRAGREVHLLAASSEDDAGAAGAADRRTFGRAAAAADDPSDDRATGRSTADLGGVLLLRALRFAGDGAGADGRRIIRSGRIDLGEPERRRVRAPSPLPSARPR